MTLRRLGRRDYAATVAEMQAFTDGRDANTPDELWLLEHPPVYTLGRAARDSHILSPGEIPVVRTDRGGQVTYHGPGQLIAYTLIDLTRLGLGVRDLVSVLEQSVIDLLATHGVEAARRSGAPGVYVGADKIAALGLRVRRGRSYHGLSLNVAMDLAPFAGIDPCGYPGLGVTQLCDLATDASSRQLDAIGDELAAILTRQLGYDRIDSLS